MFPINIYCCNSKIDLVQNLHLHLGISKSQDNCTNICEILQNNMGCTWWELFFIITLSELISRYWWLVLVPCNFERASVLTFERFEIASLDTYVRQALGFDELEYPKYSRMLVNQHHEMHTSVPYYTSSQSLENSI